LPSQAEVVAACAAVRAVVDARAGWYAAMISDGMIKDVVRDALCAAERVRGAPTSTASPKPQTSSN